MPVGKIHVLPPVKCLDVMFASPHVVANEVATPMASMARLRSAVEYS
jgi:hypothetical protein